MTIYHETCKGHDTIVSLLAGCNAKISSNLAGHTLVFVILFFNLNLKTAITFGTDVRKFCGKCMHSSI